MRELPQAREGEALEPGLGGSFLEKEGGRGRGLGVVAGKERLKEACQALPLGGGQGGGREGRGRRREEKVPVGREKELSAFPGVDKSVGLAVEAGSALGPEGKEPQALDREGRGQGRGEPDLRLQGRELEVARKGGGASRRPGGRLGRGPGGRA